MPFPMAQQVNLPACAPQEAVNTNFKVIGLAQLEIKPEAEAPKADVVTT